MGIEPALEKEAPVIVSCLFSELSVMGADAVCGVKLTAELFG
jgi:hypothetical protein